MKHGTSRRQFIKATAASSLGLSGASFNASEESEASITATPSGLPHFGSVAKKYWIDPSIAAWPAGPWRKVHIEYHTFRHMPHLGDHFNADEFGDQLVRAHVSGASIFAKDMYGYSYFPNKHGRMHPNLSFDLMGAQVAALRKRKIQVLAYYMLTWNPELADRHPEWLVVHEPGQKSGEVSEDQKAFKNTLQPGGAGPGSAKRAEDKGYRPYLWQFCIAQEGFVQGELKVANARRISHPGYAAGQCTFGIRDPWNVDRSRLMYNESANFIGKQPYYYWSPVVWGFVSELKHWKTAEEYERARHHVNEDRHFGFSANLWWSIFPSEENIMYAAHLATKIIVRFNVDTEQTTDVCSYDPGDGRDLSQVRVMGWTTDSKLIVTLGDNNGDVIPEKGGWEIDVRTKKKTYIPVARDDYSRWPAIGSHGHGTFSPDRSMFFRCGANELRALPSHKLIRTFATWSQSPPFSLEHLSWRAANDWFTSESGGPEWNRIAAKTGKWPTQPLLDKITIYQIWTDGEIKPLLTTTTACAWSGKDGVQHWNYEGEPIPDHSRDGRQLIFPSYHGLYSADDHQAFGSAPWGYCGLFLADLVPAAGNDDELAPSKPAMLKGRFDPSSQTVRLTWARCRDNVGVDSYCIYRDGRKISTTGFIDYTDAIEGPVSASYRYRIGAVDVAGNESRSAEITVKTSLISPAAGKKVR